MSTQHIIDPGKIEPELMKLWEQVSKEKTRACLFNLIIFNKLSERTDYIREIVRKVSEKYPCRVLFISSDPASSQHYLKTAISIVGEGSIACDYIDIGVAGREIEKVPFLILPHIIPDLPISLLWTEDPSIDHPLFEPLSHLATRIVFDSESADDLTRFAEKILTFKNIDVADLNWARMERWRDLLASLFQSEEKAHTIEEIHIAYNCHPTESFSHLKVQATYLISWLASRLHWTQKIHPRLKLTSVNWETVGPGTLIAVDITTSEKLHYQCARHPKQHNQVTIQISSPEKCELPHQFILGSASAGYSLIKEIMMKGTSPHFLETLQSLTKLDLVC